MPDDKRLPFPRDRVPVFIPQSLWDAMVKAGISTDGYQVTRPIPTADFETKRWEAIFAVTKRALNDPNEYEFGIGSLPSARR